MRARLSICGVLLAIVFSPAGASATAPSEGHKKNPIVTQAKEKKATLQFKHAPQAAQPKSKAKNGSPASHAQPDPKVLSLGCASGED